MPDRAAILVCQWHNSGLASITWPTSFWRRSEGQQWVGGCGWVAVEYLGLRGWRIACVWPGSWRCVSVRLVLSCRPSHSLPSAFFILRNIDCRAVCLYGCNRTGLPSGRISTRVSGAVGDVLDRYTHTAALKGQQSWDGKSTTLSCSFTLTVVAWQSVLWCYTLPPT